MSDEIQLPPHLKFEPNSGAGYHVAEQWVVSILEKHIDFADLIQQKTNYKDMLVRYMQHTHQDVPRFFEVNVTSKQNTTCKLFTYCVKDRGGVVLGTASGSSKKDAENMAAKAALEYYGQPTS
jgi:dsRNA-specific ribonuclease